MPTIETIGLADEPSHGNAVHGVVKALFGHAYHKLCSTAACLIVAPYNAQGKKQRGLPSSLTGKEQVDGCVRAELLALVQSKSVL